MAYQVILEPGRGQIREFEFPRVRPLMNFCAAFPCAPTDLRKARERELATLHENRQSVVAELYALEKIEGSNRRGGKDDTCHHGLYVQKLENRGVSKNEEKKKKTGKRDDQSAISGKGARRVRSNTNLCLSVTY